MEAEMTTQAKQGKILAAIESRGWFTPDLYWDAACELRDQKIIKMGDRYSTGGNRKPAWVKA
jgi:hypothetical protein